MSEPGATELLERVQTSFEKQGLMRLLGAEVVEVGLGTCVIEVPFRDELTQQERFFHGVVTGAFADNAGGYAALTLAPPGRGVLTAGRRLVVCKAEVFAVAEQERNACAVMLQTVSLSPVKA